MSDLCEAQSVFMSESLRLQYAFMSELFRLPDLDLVAKALRTQEDRHRALLELADVGRVVHDVAFAYERLPVDHPVWYLAFHRRILYHIQNGRGHKVEADSKWKRTPVRFE